MAEITLTNEQANELKTLVCNPVRPMDYRGEKGEIAYQGDVRRLTALVNRGLVRITHSWMKNYRVMVTDAGREYAQQQGWIAAPAAVVEPQEQPTPEATMAKQTAANNLEHAEKMAAHWLYLANQAAERGDYELEKRHLAREQKWHDIMNNLLGLGEADEPIAAPVSAEFAAAVEAAAAEYAPVLDALAASEPTPFAVGDFVYIVLASGVIMRDVVIAMNDKDLETSYSYIIPFERCFDTYPQAHEYRNSVMSAVAPKTNGTVADSLYDKLEAIAQGNVGDRTPSGIASEAIAELNALRAENDALRAQLAAARQAFEKIYTYYDEENFAKRVAYVALDSLNK